MTWYWLMAIDRKGNTMQNAIDLIEKARAKKAIAEQTLQGLQAELVQAQKDADEWGSFIERAELLTGHKPRQSKTESSNGQKATVQKGSLVAHCVTLLQEKGPMPISEITDGLTAAGHARGKDFKNNVNSCLWRRRKDLFEKKKDGKYHLRTQEIMLI